MSTPSRTDEVSGSLSPAGKVMLAADIWISLARVRLGLWRHGLPGVVERLGRRPSRRYPGEPRRMGVVVYRVLHLGPYRPRCLLSALVLYRLLRSSAPGAELVIGMPDSPTDVDAHAWVEIGDVDVGPPPGRAGHRELVRYPRGRPRGGGEA